MRRWIVTAFAVALAAAAPAQTSRHPAPDLAAAVAASDRPDDQRALDASRKPAEVLAFLGVRQGDTVADLMAGSGYYSDILATAVGPRGTVFAYEPQGFLDRPETRAAWDALVARRPNVVLTPYAWGDFAPPPAQFDFALLHLVYHDLYWQSEKFGIPRTDPALFVKALYAAMKPGGIVGVVDHVALPGDTRGTVDKLHRIDPATIKADFAAAGFVLDGESDLLRMAGDDHGKPVFDPAVRGKTDRVVLRFRRPR